MGRPPPEEDGGVAGAEVAVDLDGVVAGGVPDVLDAHAVLVAPEAGRGDGAQASPSMSRAAARPAWTAPSQCSLRRCSPPRGRRDWRRRRPPTSPGWRCGLRRRPARRRDGGGRCRPGTRWRGRLRSRRPPCRRRRRSRLQLDGGGRGGPAQPRRAAPTRTSTPSAPCIAANQPPTSAPRIGASGAGSASTSVTWTPRPGRRGDLLADEAGPDHRQAGAGDEGLAQPAGVGERPQDVDVLEGAGAGQAPRRRTRGDQEAVAGKAAAEASSSRRPAGRSRTARSPTIRSTAASAYAWRDRKASAASSTVPASSSLESGGRS